VSHAISRVKFLPSMEAESEAAADVPIHVLGSYECADGGVVNPVGVLDSSLDAEVVVGGNVSQEGLGRDVADDDDVARADPNSQNVSPVALNATAVGYLQPLPHFSCRSCFSTFLRVIRGLI